MTPINLSKILTLALLVTCTTQHLNAQVIAASKPDQHTTLAEVWNNALQYNKSIQIKQLQAEAKAEDIKDAKAERLPEINAEGEYARVSNMPLFENGLLHAHGQFPVLHTFYKVGGDAYLNLYSGDKINLKIKTEETLNQIRQEQKNMTVADVKLKTAAYFLELQKSYQFKKLIMSHIADQEKQILQIKQLLKNGVVLKSDLLRAELQLSRDKLTLTQIENDIQIESQKLDILTGQPDEAVINPDTLADVELLTVKSYDEYLLQAQANSFQNKISEQQTNLSKVALKTTKGNLAPKVGLFANYAYSYPQIQFYPYGDALFGLGMAGIKASFALDGFYHNKHKVKAAELELKSQELEHSDQQDRVRQQVKEAFLRYQEALNRIRVARVNIAQAKENARIVYNTYFNQLSLVTDLLDSDTALLQSQFELTSAQIATQMQYYQLQNVIGNL
ncbi:TolC family protein [Pedobacter duraquae]|uniref:Outer membrane protein TolC n=1 Tax=Pedobacter duraquae TaxID=425511 RepID=A0A4R6ILQ0_9SPHI|nr:TolC family protein [Pedobacter duraquae]TDO22865.1 outer membrane protein TolC [Pedobacter duraquae]